MPARARDGAKELSAGDPPAILLFRRDLRLEDNPAVAEAVASGRPIVPLFIESDGRSGARPIGAAAGWWQGQSLKALDRALADRGLRLILKRGDEVSTIATLAREIGAGALYLNWRADPSGFETDRKIEAKCRLLGVEFAAFPSNHLHVPSQIRTGAGQGFKVFTPFWRRLAGFYSAPTQIAAPKRMRAPKSWPDSLAISDFCLNAAWTRSIAQHWEPGSMGAQKTLAKFVRRAERYGSDRDRPDIDGTSRLSPHLAAGDISVHEIWRQLQGALGAKASPFLRELAWRDFNMHLMAEFGDLSARPLRPEFARFRYRVDRAGLAAWREGRTGYPIVDAGMRQLWASGWMHNRVRMIAASFLIKHLLIDWREGEAWFWDTLVDADHSQNSGNWQWVAGCGADAAPYFRIFNPIIQGRRFDPEGDYVRRWVPELKALANKYLHAPFEASPLELAASGVILGKNYPLPIVEHGFARERALAAFADMGAKQAPPR